MSDQTFPSAENALEAIQRANESLVDEIRTLREHLEIQTEAAYADLKREYYLKVARNQLSYAETVEEVAAKRLSFARYGDGEFILTADPYRGIPFQKPSVQLARELRTILRTPSAGLLVGMPHLATGSNWWLRQTNRYWGIISTEIGPHPIWGAASVSRANGLISENGRVIRAWKSCWEKRHVTIVAGKGSRFELIPELFSDVADVEMIHSKPRNAYDDVDEIVRKVLEKERDIVLLALGPTATILASRFASLGIQAIDVGHISASYKEAFESGLPPEKLPFES